MTEFFPYFLCIGGVAVVFFVLDAVKQRRLDILTHEADLQQRALAQELERYRLYQAAKDALKDELLQEVSMHRDHLVNTNTHIRERVAVLEAALKNFLTQAQDLLRLEAAAKQKLQAENYEQSLRGRK